MFGVANDHALYRDFAADVVIDISLRNTLGFLLCVHHCRHQKYTREPGHAGPRWKQSSHFVPFPKAKEPQFCREYVLVRGQMKSSRGVIFLLLSWMDAAVFAFTPGHTSVPKASTRIKHPKITATPPHRTNTAAHKKFYRCSGHLHVAVPAHEKPTTNN